MLIHPRIHPHKSAPKHKLTNLLIPPNLQIKSNRPPLKQTHNPPLIQQQPNPNKPHNNKNPLPNPNPLHIKTSKQQQNIRSFIYPLLIFTFTYYI